MNRLNIKNFLFTMCWLSMGQLPLIQVAQAAPDPLAIRADRPHLKIIVTSNQDTISADDGITLREAISLANGDLKLDRLSDRERTQVRDLGANSSSQIELQLPTGSTKIELTSELPAIQAPGVSIDGTTQTGFVKSSITKTSIVLPTPVVELSPANGVEVARGISILADDVTIRGLSIYGFTVGRNDATQNVPAGDIFIAHRLPPPDTTEHQPPAANFLFRDSNFPPQNVTIEGNFLGIKPDKTMPAIGSDFGVYMFNSKGTTIRHNTIKSHSASGIITSVKADNLQIQENILTGNGTSGMPDAIRLEGEIRNNQIDTNLICANDGSAVFLFKPSAGAVNIHNNTINFNGRRLRRAAIHLMGSDHQVIDNNISSQAGAGVSVSAFPEVDRSIGNSAARNIVKSNRFSLLEGLSIDLNTYRNGAVEDFQDGDGINPPRNSENRRLDTANMAINAPRFLSSDFLILNDRVNVDGIADPGTKVELYKASKDAIGNESLSRSLTTVNTNAQGKFSATLTNLQPGEMISAIATDPKYGSSEPARNAIVMTPGAIAQPERLSTNIPTPGCPTAIPKIANADPELQIASQVVTPPAPLPVSIQPVQLKIIPSTVHFALDKSNITPASAEIIKQITKVLKEYPYIVIDLEGHTDPRANNDYNQRLGMRRAIATRKYLVSQGIDSARITIRSQGDTRRKSARTGILDYARDRRVEFVYRDVRGLQLGIIDREDDLQLERRRSRSKKSI
jgi:outer membrane protein OmpA-like peptidoglycan-associated protein